MAAVSAEGVVRMPVDDMTDQKSDEKRRRPPTDKQGVMHAHSQPANGQSAVRAALS